MSRLTRCAFVLILAAGLGGCRQADGQPPTPSDDQRNEIGDIARDMMNVAAKDPAAPEDLRSDLSKYAPNDEAAEPFNALANELSAALAGVRLDEQSAQSLADTIWIGLNGRELSERQVEALGRDVKAALASTGVSEDRAESIAARLGAIQKTITDNPRRWYQVF